MRLLLAALMAILPSWIKVTLYRALFGYAIGRNVRIGVSILYRVGKCSIGDGARIGHLNFFGPIEDLRIGKAATVGAGNVFRGGRRVRIGDYASILRFNVFNSIRDAESVNPRSPDLELGPGCVVTAGHWVDYTDRVSLGANVIVGGRNSSIWTHNRQRTRPVDIGHHNYLGSEVKVAPGVSLGPLNVVALGSVVIGAQPAAQSLIAGNPAQPIRTLKEQEWALVGRRNRPDIPDDVAYLDLPDPVRQAAVQVDNEVRLNNFSTE